MQKLRAGFSMATIDSIMVMIPVPRLSALENYLVLVFVGLWFISLGERYIEQYIHVLYKSVR